MGLLARIRDLFRMFVSFFLEGAEDRVPLERRLAYDRARRAENLKRQMNAAEDVGAAAELMVQQLAESRIIAANLRHEAKAHLTAAAAAASRGDDTTRVQEEGRARALSEELAEAEFDIAQLEQLVEDSLADKKEAIAMVLDQAKELEKMSRGDSRLVARVRMTEMRRQQLALREEMMELVPGTQDTVRARVREKSERDEARYRARRDVVDALWSQKRRGMADQALSTSAAGQAKLEELMKEVGYSQPAAAPAPPVEAPAQEETMEAGGRSS